MDPTTWPMWAKVLAGWGPLGVWAGVMTYAYFKSQRTHDKALTAQAARFAGVVAVMTKDAQAREDKLHDEHRDVLMRISVTFTNETREAELRHSAQEDELIERLLTANEKHGETTKGLAERLAALAESMKRRGGDSDGPSST